MNHETLLGQQLGPYQIESLVGQGGMAVVYRARHQQGDVVALKVLTLPAAMGDELLARFQREAETTARLNHPAIVSVLDVGQAEGHVYLAMPLIKGQNLSDMLREHGALPEAKAIDIAWQMADALHYAHSQGVVHRDVKPSNILVTEDGSQAMLTDFGVALALDAPSLTRTGHTVGTPAYMAPEQASGDEAVGGRADLYSLGVVLYHMVTGKLPFQGTTPQIMYGHVHQPPPSPAEIAHISPALDTVILKALAKAVDQRYQSGTAFAQALTLIDAQDDHTQFVLEPTTASIALPASKSQPNRLRWLLGSIGLLLIMLFMAMARPLLSPPLTTPTVTPTPTDEVVAFVTETPTPIPTSTPLPFPAGALLQGSGKGIFWLHDDGTVQHIYDWSTYLTFGFDPDEIRLTEDALLDDLFQGEELTRLLQAESGAIDWVIEGQRWRIDHWQETLAQTGYLAYPPSRADTTLLNRLPLKVVLNELPEGTLIQEGDNLHRLFDERLLRRFANPDLLIAYGYDSEPIIDLPTEVHHLYRNGSPLTELLQAEGDEAVYRLEAGQRRLMPTGDALWALGYGIEEISHVSAAFMDGFPLGEPFEPPLTPTPEPTATPTVTPTATPCLQPLPDSLNRNLAPDFYARLGCPAGEPITTLAARQQFQEGFMLWRQDELFIYAVTTDSLTIIEDSWQHTVDIDYDPALTPPQEELIQPVRGFGKAWRNNEDVQTGLGWAITQEDGFEATIQPFANGFAWQGEEDDFVTLILMDGGYILLGEGE